MPAEVTPREAVCRLSASSARGITGVGGGGGGGGDGGGGVNIFS